MKRSILRAAGVAAVLFLSGACSTGGPDANHGTVQQAFAAGATGTGTISAPGTQVNSYAAVTANIAAASRTVTVADVQTLGSGFGLGSLLMVMQMQGATINTSDTAAYGDVTALNGAGTFEFVHVESVQNNTITVDNACGGFKNAYTAAGHVQVIRVPEYTTLTINNDASIVGLPWDGSVGGVVAVRVVGATIFLGASSFIDASAMGFRGGAVHDATGTGISTFCSNTTDGAQKGESIAGSATEYAAGCGAFGRGAPANGGGGGNANNAGGGGGANAGLLASWNGNGIMTGTFSGVDPWSLDPAGPARTTSTGGGRGGYTSSAANGNAQVDPPGNATWGGDNRRAAGGLGGRPLASGPGSATRYFLGGGGGAGDANNGAATAGGRGGGLVFIESGSITGSAGTVRARGGSAGNSGNDGAGGGGGGGSIVIVSATVPPTIALDARGGDGGNQTSGTAEAQGPGGGGGGGYVANSGGTALVAGGLNGTTSSPSLNEFRQNGATTGGAGDGLAVPLTATQLAALSCYANNPPVNTAPVALSVVEDGTVAFTGASTVSVRDPDALGNPIQVTLLATNGTMTIGPNLTGLTFSEGGGNSDPKMTFSGTVAALNAALMTLKYAPNPNFWGTDTLTIITSDQGNTSTPSTPKTDSDSIAITVTPINDDPPVAKADIASGQPGVPVDIDVLANDTDPDVPPTVLTILSASTPSTGATTVVGGKVRYTAPAGATGTATFFYVVSDGSKTAIGNVTVTIGSSTTDADKDGLLDSIEVAIGTNPNDADSDDDGVKDGDEPSFDIDSDGDGLVNALDPDSDNDGLFDGTELGLDCGQTATDPTKHHCIADADPASKTDPLKKDTDGGGKSDGSEDANLNGKVDTGETNPATGQGADDSGAANADGDGDGLSDALEKLLGSNPADADSDDDGLLDGEEANPSDDTDDDGARNLVDADSDNDGLFDGMELSKACSNPATDPTKKRCTVDADPTTKTSPLVRNTDAGGVDTDKDGLLDELEKAIGTNPLDADSDDDGLLDGQEPNPTEDSDGDGLINPLDADSDNDGLFDGTEMGKGCADPATDKAKKKCIVDVDPLTRTSPLLADTDNGGIADGSEDPNRNGQIDIGETDPTRDRGSDDKNNKDTDGDGLTDAFEAAIGSNPTDVDTDDDGVRDGLEPNPAEDTDGDGKLNVLDPDSDGDGLFDGTELGLGCDGTNTDRANSQCLVDDDPATRTGVLDPDTDKGGVMDGAEDANHDGKVDTGERDPLVKDDDDNTPGGGCAKDSECGANNSGLVCTVGDGGFGSCVPGCRGVKGNTCPSGQTCSSSTGVAGTCAAAIVPDAGPSVPSAPPPDRGSLGGGGCSTTSRAPASTTAWWLGLGLVLAYGRRRRSRLARSG